MRIRSLEVKKLKVAKLVEQRRNLGAASHELAMLRNHVRIMGGTVVVNKSWHKFKRKYEKAALDYHESVLASVLVGSEGQNIWH